VALAGGEVSEIPGHQGIRQGADSHLDKFEIVRVWQPDRQGFCIDPLAGSPEKFQQVSHAIAWKHEFRSIENVLIFGEDSVV